MKNINVISILATGTVGILVCALGPLSAFAATTPALGAAETYAILSSTFTNTSAGTTVNGDIGFTTPPAVTPLGIHTNYGSAPPYAAAGTDQGAALSALNSELCTYTFPGGAVDLATDITHGPIGVYTAGVYCSTGAMDVGGPITLSGGGTFIFRPVGALTSTAGAAVNLVGSSACNIFWTPSAATTLAANTAFFGTIIGNAGITVGANTVWTGRALAFGGTITTDTDTITAPVCTPVPATLHVVKLVINNTIGTATSSDFTLHVKNGGVDVTGSPQMGTSASGTPYTLAAGTYVVSEDVNAAYTQSFSGDCDASGNITLLSGDDKTCIITNSDIPPPPSPPTPTAPAAVGNGPIVDSLPVVSVPSITSIIEPTPLAPTILAVSTAGLPTIPNTGFTVSGAAPTPLVPATVTPPTTALPGVPNTGVGDKAGVLLTALLVAVGALAALVYLRARERYREVRWAGLVHRSIHTKSPEMLDSPIHTQCR